MPDVLLCLIDTFWILFSHSLLPQSTSALPSSLTSFQPMELLFCLKSLFAVSLSCEAFLVWVINGRPVARVLFYYITPQKTLLITTADCNPTLKNIQYSLCSLMKKTTKFDFHCINSLQLCSNTVVTEPKQSC